MANRSGSRNREYRQPDESPRGGREAWRGEWRHTWDDEQRFGGRDPYERNQRDPGYGDELRRRGSMIYGDRERNFEGGNYANRDLGGGSFGGPDYREGNFGGDTQANRHWRADADRDERNLQRWRDRFEHGGTGGFGPSEDWGGGVSNFSRYGSVQGQRDDQPRQFGASRGAAESPHRYEDQGHGAGFAQYRPSDARGALGQNESEYERRNRSYDRYRDDPSWIERAEQSFRGRGPKGYSRTDERIREDLSDRLMDDPLVDASEITVHVSQGEITLEGSVETRRQKHRADDIAEQVRGVIDVHNRLRVQKGLIAEVTDRLKGRDEPGDHRGEGPRTASPGAAAGSTGFGGSNPNTSNFRSS